MSTSAILTMVVGTASGAVGGVLFASLSILLLFLLEFRSRDRKQSRVHGEGMAAIGVIGAIGAIGAIGGLIIAGIVGWTGSLRTGLIWSLALPALGVGLAGINLRAAWKAGPSRNPADKINKPAVERALLGFALGLCSVVLGVSGVCSVVGIMLASRF